MSRPRTVSVLVLDRMRDGRRATKRELADELGITTKSVGNAIATLEGRVRIVGVARKEGVGKRPYIYAVVR